METHTSLICPAASEQELQTQSQPTWRLAQQTRLKNFSTSWNWTLCATRDNADLGMDSEKCARRHRPNGNNSVKYHHWWWELVPQLQQKIKIRNTEWHHLTSEKASTNAHYWQSYGNFIWRRPVELSIANHWLKWIKSILITYGPYHHYLFSGSKFVKRKHFMHEEWNMSQTKELWIRNK
jgi:hypothetical protein